MRTPFLRITFTLGLLLSLNAISLFGQKKIKFPTVSTEMISGREVTFPDAFAGKYALVGIGTSKKAEKELRTWQVPVYNKFVLKTGLMDAMYQVEIAFLPLFTGAAQVAKNQVIKDLKATNEALVLDHLYIYSGNRAPFTEIGVEDKTEPYFLLIDAEGRIIWRAEGAFKQAYLDQVEEILWR